MACVLACKNVERAFMGICDTADNRVAEDSGIGSYVFGFAAQCLCDACVCPHCSETACKVTACGSAPYSNLVLAQPEEIAEAFWLPIEEAATRLTYERDRKIMRDAFDHIRSYPAPTE